MTPPREKGLAAVPDKGHSVAPLPGRPPCAACHVIASTGLLLPMSHKLIYTFPHEKRPPGLCTAVLLPYQMDMTPVSGKVGRQTDTRARGVSMCATLHISVTLDILAPVGNSQSTPGSPLRPAPCLVLFRGHDIYTNGSQTY